MPTRTRGHVDTKNSQQGLLDGCNTRTEKWERLAIFKSAVRSIRLTKILREGKEALILALKRQEQLAVKSSNGQEAEAARQRYTALEATMEEE
jgi:hypothetical protein